jgi:cytochrome c biogenesis protein CcdA
VSAARPVDDGRPSGGGRAAYYWALVASTALLALAGYAGYALYPRFELPAAAGIALFALAAGAGVASFFSPCSFGLLVTLLARVTGAEGRRTPSTARPLRFSLAMATGAALFLMLAGTALALGAGAIFERVTFTSTAGIAIRTAVASVLVLLGLVQLGVIPVAAWLGSVAAVARPAVSAPFEGRRETLGFGVFGFGYLLAGFG